MNWWEEVKVESQAEVGTVRALKAVPGTNGKDKLTDAPWRICTAFQTVCD